MATIPLVPPPEIPLHPSAEELALYRHVAVNATTEMVQRVGNAFGTLPVMPEYIVLDALNAQGDYFIARMRWQDDHRVRGE